MKNLFQNFKISKFQNFKISKFNFLIVMILSSIAIFSCMKEDKSAEFKLQKNLKTEARTFTDCGPDPNQTGCTSTTYTNVSVPTFMGCSAVATYSVLVCETNSIPPIVTSIAVYDLDLNYSANCTVLVDSIEYYIINFNQTRANYLIQMFYRLATQNIEASVIAQELNNPALYQCKENALVNLEFFSSKCTKFRLQTKKQVVCGLGCCKRATGYCFDGTELKKSVPAISQSAPCELTFDECVKATECTASACDILIPVVIGDPN